MDAKTILAKLRQKDQLTGPEIEWFVRGLADETVSEAQSGAFAMAICLNGMSKEGRVRLTRSMRDSGDVLKWDLSGPLVDKHSTGGLGDCVSLVLAPMLAAAGCFVPMVSGRGLGHTGGTLDKLEAIPGVSTEVSQTTFQAHVAEIGCAIVAASADIAPADRRLYALRDATGTVDSIDLITASILSKKLAAGMDHLVLDVKAGTGAFMQTTEDARELAEILVETANDAGCKTTALITDMNQPVATSIGNATELAEVMHVLQGEAEDGPLVSLSVDLGAELMVSAGMTATKSDAERRLRDTLSSGSALEIWSKMVAAFGAPVDFVENWKSYLPSAPVIQDVPAAENGYVSGFNGIELGMAVMHLGGGRRRAVDAIDPAVGLTDIRRIGDQIEKGDPICRVHAKSASDAKSASAKIVNAVHIHSDPVPPPGLILGKIT